MAWGTPTGVRKGDMGHAANPTLAFSGAVTVGDALFCLACVSGTTTRDALTGVSDSVNGAWTALSAMQYNGTSDKGLRLFFFPNTAAGTPTVTVSGGATAMDGQIFIWRAPGGATSSLPDGTPAQLSGNASVPGNATTYTPAQNNSLVIGAYYATSIAGVAAQNGFTLGDSGTTDGSGAWAYLIQTTAAGATAPFSAPSTNWAFLMGGFKVAGAAATTWGQQTADQWCRVVQGAG